MANISAENLNTSSVKFSEIILQTVKIARPTHWVKNLAIFAALAFSGNLFNKVLLGKTLVAFFSFSFAASATYIFNDIKDIKLDQIHPIKRMRPIAANKLPLLVAKFAIFYFLLASFFISTKLNPLFLLMLIGYAFLQLAYSLGLKNLPIVDILVIATGFIIRVYAGAFVIDAHLSVWFLLCVISLALFLASGKRRAELGVVSAIQKTTRKSLARYPRVLLDAYVTMFGNAAWLSWAIFTFFESPPASTPVWLFLAELSRTTAISKLLMITIPVVIFGIMRYQALIFQNRTEAPEKLFLTDKPLVFASILWITMVVFILYGGVVAPS